MGLFHAYIYIGALGRRPHLGGRALTWERRVPASALPSWGSMPQLGNKKMYCICLSRHRALTSKCRRGDASPPGEDASPPGEDALPAGEDASTTGEGAFLSRAYIRVHNIYLETFLVPCFIFITQCIDNQYFQLKKPRVSHGETLEFYVSFLISMFQWCFSHWGLISLPLRF